MKSRSTSGKSLSSTKSIEIIQYKINTPLVSSVFYWEGGECLFEAGCLLTNPSSRMGGYSRWALIRGWALNRCARLVLSVCFD